MNIGSLTKARNTLSIWYKQVRNSRYSAKHVEPTFKKEDLQQELGVDDPRRYSPIKAATNEQTSFATRDDLVAKFIKIVMKEGDKDTARYVVFKAFENMKLIQIDKFNKATDFEKESIELDPIKIFAKAVENCKPLLKLEKISRGGVLYQVPVPLSSNSMIFFSMKWLIESAKEKDKTHRVWDKLANELLDASNNEGKSIKKKQELHRLCEANRAYAHFRW